MKVTRQMRAEWLLRPDSYVAPELINGGVGWYAARRNDRSFHSKTKTGAINRAVRHAIINP